MSTLWLAPILAFAITAALLVVLLAVARSRMPLDHPNPRSLHARPVPRIGGIAVVAAAICAALVLRRMEFWLAIGAALALVSFVDDLRGLPVLTRLTAHGAAAAAFLFIGFDDLSWVLAAGLFLGIVWMINLYNFMDGSDGLAGGMALFGFGGYALAAWSGGAVEFASLFASIAAASGGFLLFNFPPARVFLGDAGSIPLGFLAAAGGIIGWRRELWPLWFPLLVFSPFAVDATVTLARRMARGEKFWEPHFDHYYQRLVRMGWGHRRTALAEYACMLACVAAAITALPRGAEIQGMILGGTAVLYALAVWRVERAWRARQGGFPDA